MNESYSHGKLLISGEYVVLHGASALAIPLRPGQHFQVTESADDGLVWQSYYRDQLWFEGHFTADLHIVSSFNDERAAVIARILDNARRLAGKGNDFYDHKFVVTRLDFDPSWGLGSSSTLIINVSRWMGIDPFQLSALTLGGSNYDIACSMNHHPILYCRDGYEHHVRKAAFAPPFADYLWFVFLGNKADSRQSVAQLVGDALPSADLIERVTHISEMMVACSDFGLFCDLIDEHERLIGDYIDVEPVKSRLFPDFKGSIKSLGAWGGDFVMVASQLPVDEIESYFSNKGLDVMFKYVELSLNVE